MRGGGGNFGVVTAFEFEAIDPGPILAGYIHYPVTAVKQVLRQLASMAESAPGALELTAQIGPHEEVVAGLSVRVGVCWPGDIAAGTDILRPLRAALPAISDTVGPMEYPDIQDMSGRLAFGLRHYWKGHFLRSARRIGHRRDRGLAGGAAGQLQLHPARGDPWPGTRRARGRRGVRAACGDVERECPRRLG